MGVESSGYEKGDEQINQAHGLDEVEMRQAAIANCSSFDELYKVIDTFDGGIPGTLNGEKYNYPPNELKAIIDRARIRKHLVNDITRTYGIRAKVIQLLDAEDESDTGEVEKPLIKHAQDFRQLYAAMRALDVKTIGSSERTIEEEIRVIEEVRSGKATPLGITRDEGLREKVIELLGGKKN